jgi:hypothetical protein
MSFETNHNKSERMAYKLDGDLLVVQQVCTFEDHTERPLSNLLANTIMYTDNVGRRGGHRGRGFEEESRCEEMRSARSRPTCRSGLTKGAGAVSNYTRVLRSCQKKVGMHSTHKKQIHCMVQIRRWKEKGTVHRFAARLEQSSRLSS